MKINGMKKAIAMAGAVGAMMCPMLANAADSPVPTVDVWEDGEVIQNVQRDGEGNVTSFEFTEEVADGYIDIDLDNDGEAEHVYVRDGKFDAQVSNTADFVSGFYTETLGREFDQEGMDTWLNAMVDNGQGGSEIAHGFFASEEFVNEAKGENGVFDDDEIDAVIEKFYQTMLGRAADEAGKATWTACLKAGMTMDALVQGFAYSDEFAEKCGNYGVTPGEYQSTAYVDKNYERTAFASRLYTEALGRDYDAAGLESWCEQIDKGLTGSEVAYGFVFSDELKNKELSDEAFVDMLYKTILGRVADADGKATWLAELSKGESRERVFNGFIQSVEFEGFCARANIIVGDPIEE